MTGRIQHPDAPAGKAEKYARPERERRFLLRALPPGAPIATIRIEDRYVDGTRLRVRRMIARNADGVEIGAQYKLAQKLPAADGTPGLITNVYLSAAEYDRLAALPAAMLRKTRHAYPPFGVDVFEGLLAGLILAEIEFGSDEAERAFEPAIDVVAEVTSDVRFTGGNLIRTTAADMRALLTEFGIR